MVTREYSLAARGSICMQSTATRTVAFADVRHELDWPEQVQGLHNAAQSMQQVNDYLDGLDGANVRDGLSLEERAELRELAVMAWRLYARLNALGSSHLLAWSAATGRDIRHIS